MVLEPRNQDFLFLFIFYFFGKINGRKCSAASAAQNTNISPISLQNNSISFKLAEGNYLFWKQYILATVICHDLEGYLNGEQEVPPKMVLIEGMTTMKLNSAYLAWRRQDQLLSAWIQSSLTESVVVLVVGLTTSKDIWKALEVNFASQSKAKMMQYKLQLQTMKKQSLPMREYLGKIKTRCHALGAASCVVSEQDQILHILSSLGPEYDAVMVAIAAKEGSWKVREVASLLLSFELRTETTRGVGVNVDGSQPSANFVQAPNLRRDSTQQGGGSYTSHGRGDGEEVPISKYEV